MKSFVAVLLALCFVAYCVAEPEGHGHGHGHHSGGESHPPGYNPLIRVCRDDMKKWCPDLHPGSLKDLFESECFKIHEDELNPACKKLMEDFRANGGHTSIPTNNPPPAHPPVHPSPGTSGGSSGSTTGSSAMGTPFYEACDADRRYFCPEIAYPVDEPVLFSSDCFQRNLKSVSPACKTFYEKYVINKHFLIGIFISGGMMMMASVLLSVLTVCCCVACCIRVCVRRRAVCRMQKLSSNVDSLELGAKSINNNDGQEEQEQLPSTQFVFPMNQYPAQAAAFSPYSGHPQYMQPVFTVVQQ